MIEFGNQEVKGQGHVWPKLDLTARQKCHSRPIWSSSFL